MQLEATTKTTIRDDNRRCVCVYYYYIILYPVIQCHIVYVLVLYCIIFRLQLEATTKTTIRDNEQMAHEMAFQAVETERLQQVRARARVYNVHRFMYNSHIGRDREGGREGGGEGEGGGGG